MSRNQRLFGIGDIVRLRAALRLVPRVSTWCVGEGDELLTTMFYWLRVLWRFEIVEE